MAKNAKIGSGRRSTLWRIFGWGMAALVLLLPLVAMQFTNEVRWDGEDFIFAGVVFGIIGGTFELAVRMSRNAAYRMGVAAALAAAFVIVWANGAVGMIGDEGNPYNFLFLGVIGLALAGSIIARFRPAGMALAMIAAAMTQGVIGAFGLPADVRGGILSMVLGGLWLVAGALFRKAAEEQGALRITA